VLLVGDSFEPKLVTETITASAYSGVAVYFVVAAILACIIFGLSIVVATHLPDSAKRSAYECGFEAFTDSRVPFDVRFYLVGILFIVFDLEAAFLYPWAANLGHLGALGFWSIIDFVIELCVGLCYVWRVGALEW
jgi:NADH-quinone oxidoreductase subunit A